MILETIVITTNADGSAHLAPFGIREHNGRVIIAPYRPSTTLNNILRSNIAVVCATDDVRVFAGTLTGRCNWPLCPAEVVSGYVLQSALAHRELVLDAIKEEAVRPELILQVVHEAIHAAFRGFNRAQAAVLEAAILVSRLPMLPLSKIEAEIAYLAIAVEKTAGEREREAWAWLLEAVDNHRAALHGSNLA